MIVRTAGDVEKSPLGRGSLIGFAENIVLTERATSSEPESMFKLYKPNFGFKLCYEPKPPNFFAEFLKLNFNLLHVHSLLFLQVFSKMIHNIISRIQLKVHIFTQFLQLAKKINLRKTKVYFLFMLFLFYLCYLLFFFVQEFLFFYFHQL